LRARLRNLIGEASYRVGCETYHEFSARLIQDHPEYFPGSNLRTPADDLLIHKILSEILARLDYGDPLAYLDENKIRGLISDARQALLEPDDVENVAKLNDSAIDFINSRLNEIFDPAGKMPGDLTKARPLYEKFAEILDAAPSENYPPAVPPLTKPLKIDLDKAFTESDALGKAKPLNAYKTKILTKNSAGRFELKATKQNPRLHSLAKIYAEYLQNLSAADAFDYDDMIIQAIRAIETNADLKFDLQERYQYILLDEYQDTNAAQAKLIELLTDNPLADGRPNVLAVGDDDQAIYAFQGALSSNLHDFAARYDGTKIITLTTNYRSAKNLIDFSKTISAQISDPIVKDKPLDVAEQNADLAGRIERLEFQTDVAENAWTAAKIKSLLDGGAAPGSIAVLARNNKELINLVPYFDPSIPLSFEKQANILTDSPAMRDILLIAHLIVDLNDGADQAADALWPEVLSLPLFKLDPIEIWRLSWRARDTKKSWAETGSDLPPVQKILEWALAARTKTLEEMLDEIGAAMREYNYQTSSCQATPDSTFGEHFFLREKGSAKPRDDGRDKRSPKDKSGAAVEAAQYPSLDAHNEKSQVQNNGGEISQNRYDLYDLLTSLGEIRQTMRGYAQPDQTLTLRNLVEFADDCAAAGIRLLHTSPYKASDQAVSLMTVHKAKGQEWERVFIIGARQETWVKSRDQSHLPANFAALQPSGDRPDDQKRLLFVALSRAKRELYITNSTGDLAGKTFDRLEYFDESENDAGQLVSRTLPPNANIVKRNDATPPTAQTLRANWLGFHYPSDAAMKNLIADKIRHFRLSASTLLNFLDPEYGGPSNFFQTNILQFPQAPNEYNVFGSAIHTVLQQIETAAGRDAEKLQQVFNGEIGRSQLSQTDRAQLTQHGEVLIRRILAERSDITAPDPALKIAAEVGFGGDNITANGVPLTGKIDRLEINPSAKTLSIVDWKTGRAPGKSDKKLHRYTLQLYFYKLLAAGSRAYRDFSADGGRLEFIDPDKNSDQFKHIDIKFNWEDERRLVNLIAAVWRRIEAQDFRDVSADYDSSTEGMIQFEDDLLSGKFD
jgi:DNA helicase-2/ATP-dependent DNA helicase PcrA